MENITEALAVTVFGVLIVFAVLVILMLILSLMKVFAPSGDGKKEEPAPVKEAVASSVKTEDEDELVAVLAAAIASSLDTKVSNFRIRSYKRLS